MKVLRVYDHLGELKKEFNVYVEGPDFKWQASYPEVIWLGTISLEEAGKEPEAEPTPEVELSPEVVEVSSDVETWPLKSEPEAIGPKPEVTEKEVKDEPEKPGYKSRRDKGSRARSNLTLPEELHQDSH